MTSSSSTARTVLQGVWLTTCDPLTRYRVADDLATYTEAAMVQLFGRRQTERFHNRAIRLLMRAAERVMLPGICSHYVARKNAIFGVAVSAQVEQLVVLGAGFDGLTWRFALMRPNVRCIEIDHPLTQVEKCKVLASLPPRNVALLPCDLSDAEAVTRVINELPRVPTLFVAEGLLMYLPQSAVTAILSTIAHRNDQAIVSMMTLNDAGLPAFEARQTLMQKYLNYISEPFTWGVKLEEVAGSMSGLGLRVETLFGAPMKGIAINKQVDMIPGEWLASLRGHMS